MSTAAKRSSIASGLRSIALIGAGVAPLACYSGAPDGEPASDSSDELGDGGSGDDGGSDGDDGVPGACVDDSPASPPIRRLTNAEFVNTIMDTLGVDVAAEASTTLPEDIRSEGFSNMSAALLVTYDRVEAYRALAKATVAKMPDLAATVDAAASCSSFTDACERSVVASFGQRLWRRPLTESEIDGLVPIFDAVAEEDDAFTDAAGLLLEALLQTPQFLYRLESEWPTDGQPGDVRALDGYEMASRLSYLVWGSAPDDALYAAAADDALSDASTIEAEVLRMLELPRARQASLRYIEDWQALEGLPALNRDPALYPEFSSALAEGMREESLAVADEILWEQRAPISALLTADFTIVSPELAAFYGFADIQSDVARYSLADDAHRLGLLTHAGILAINGQGNRPSIVERGLFILGGVMCRGVAAPPADLDTTMAELEEGQSERYYSAARLANTTCATCHGQFDSLGYGFEPFDGVGAFRTHDENGNALLEDGWYFDGSEQQIPYASAKELATGLAQSEAVVECIGLRKPLQFALGRTLGPDDGCTLETLGEALAVGDGSYQALIVAIATHPTFRVTRTTGSQ